MAFKYYASAWRLGRELGLPTSQRIVLLLLADVANDRGVSWWSHSKIATATGQSTRTVCAALQALESHDLITRSPRRDEKTGARISDLIELHIPQPLPTDDPSHEIQGAGARDSGGEDSGGEATAPGSPQEIQGAGARGAEKPRKEPRREPTPLTPLRGEPNERLGGDFLALGRRLFPDAPTDERGRYHIRACIKAARAEGAETDVEILAYARDHYPSLLASPWDRWPTLGEAIRDPEGAELVRLAAGGDDACWELVG